MWGMAVVGGAEPEDRGGGRLTARVSARPADHQPGAGGDTDRFGPPSREVMRASRVQVDDLGGQGVPGGSRLVIVLASGAGSECGRSARIAEALKPPAGVDLVDTGDGSAHFAVRNPSGSPVNGRNRVLQSLPAVGEYGDRRSESRDAPISQWSLEMVDGLPARLLSG